MKELQQLHDNLKQLKYDLFDNYRTGFAERFEMTGSFMENDLDDAIGTIDEGIDRIKELEEELEDALKAAEEWEGKYNETL